MDNRETDQREAAKNELLSPAHADNLAIALAHYVFRDGPIEDMHANGQLSQGDMMALNKFVANKIATLIHLASGDRWDCLYTLLCLLMLNGDEWDAPEVDPLELETLFGNGFKI